MASGFLQCKDAKGFIGQAVHLIEPGDRNNIDAVLQVSVSANRELYEAIRRRDEDMCDAMRELMREDFEKMEEEYEKKRGRLKKGNRKNCRMLCLRQSEI